MTGRQPSERDLKYDYFQISVLDLITILFCVTRLHDKEEYVDAYQSYDDFLNRWRPYQRLSISKSMLEKALFCCKELNDKGEFWSPRGMDFDAWVNSILRNRHYDYDKVFSLVVKEGMKEKIKYEQD